MAVNEQLSTMPTHVSVTSHVSTLRKLHNVYSALCFYLQLQSLWYSTVCLCVVSGRLTDDGNFSGREFWTESLRHDRDLDTMFDISRGDRRFSLARCSYPEDEYISLSILTHFLSLVLANVVLTVSFHFSNSNFSVRLIPAILQFLGTDKRKALHRNLGPIIVVRKFTCGVLLISCWWWRIAHVKTSNGDIHTRGEFSIYKSTRK